MACRNIISTVKTRGYLNGVPERRIFHEAPFHGFLECTRVFVHTTLAIKGGWRGFHTARGTAIRTVLINWKDSPQIVAKG